MDDQKAGRQGPIQKRDQAAVLAAESVGFRQWLRRVIESPDGLATLNGPCREYPPHVTKALDPVTFGKRRDAGPVGALAQPQETCRGQKDPRGKAPERNSHHAAPGHGVASLVSKQSSQYRSLRGKRLDVDHAGQALRRTKAGHLDGLPLCRSQKAAQHNETAQRTRVSIAGHGNRHPDGPKAGHALTLDLDPSDEAAQPGGTATASERQADVSFDWMVLIQKGRNRKWDVKLTAAGSLQGGCRKLIQ